MVENVCVTVSNYATEALQDTLNFYGKEGFSLVSTQMAPDKYGNRVMYLFFVRHRILDNGHSWNHCPNCGAKMDGGGGDAVD